MKQLTKYMKLKKEVEGRRKQLNYDVSEIMELLRDKYRLGDEADKFSMTESAMRGCKGAGQYASFSSTKDRISFNIFLPTVENTITSKARPASITISDKGYFIFQLCGCYRALGTSPNSNVFACINRCREFFSEIRKINPRYLGE